MTTKVWRDCISLPFVGVKERQGFFMTIDFTEKKVYRLGSLLQFLRVNLRSLGNKIRQANRLSPFPSWRKGGAERGEVLI